MLVVNMRFTDCLYVTVNDMKWKINLFASDQR